MTSNGTRWRRRGLSPRGRGNQLHGAHGDAKVRSIPAWAGEPPLVKAVAAEALVYPRVGGGTAFSRNIFWRSPGLSPRGRGNLSPHEANHVTHGSIPAWAGEPSRGSRGVALRTVYPRVGGGTRNPPVVAPMAEGLSPRGRGNPNPCQPNHGKRGSIPAWAGEPPISRVGIVQATVYPRVGGGTQGGGKRRVMGVGLSPRGRGNHA